MMPHRKKSSKLAHFFLLPFSLCLVGGVAVSGLALAQTAEERKAEEDRILNSCRDNLNAQKFQEALLACQAALEDFKRTDNLSGQGLALNNIGNAYNALKQYQKVIEYYQQSLVIVKQLGNNKAESTINFIIGMSYILLEDVVKGREFLLTAQELAKKIGDRDTEKKIADLLNEISQNVSSSSNSRKAEADRLLNQGNQQFQISQFEAAFQSWQQALKIYREIKDRQAEGSALGSLGSAYQDLGKYDKAIEYHLQSLEIYREIKDRRGEGATLGNLGSAYGYLDKYDKAIKFSLQSLEIYREIKDRRGEGNALGNLGLAYDSLGKYDKAIDYHLQSLEIKREIKNREGEGATLGNLGGTYISLGKYDKAIESHLQSLAIAREIKDRLGEGNALGNLGLAYDSLGKYDKAIDYHLQSLAIMREIKNRRGEGSVLGNLGSAYRDLGKYDKALEYHLQRLVIAREIKDRLGEGNALGNLGAAYNSLGKYDKAIDYHLQSLAIMQEIKSRDGERIPLSNIGEAFNNLKQPELAILFYKQSINVREAIRKNIRKLDKDLQQSYLAKVESSYRDLADILLQQNRIIEALQVLDLLKVQELEDYLKNIKGSDRSAQGVRLLAPEKALSDKLLTISLDNSQDINNQLANQIQQLPKTEINKVPDYLNQIPKGTVLLYPFILGDRLEIILFSPNNLPIRRTTKISKDQLETLINDFRAGLLDAGSEDVKEPSIQLYNLLIKPIETELAQLNTKTILYAPDGQLRYIPIAALYDGKQWLVEKYQISNLIAYTLSDFTPQPKNAPNILAGAFGGKAGDRKFGQTALPATVREVQAIANSFQNSVTLIEEQFSRQAIESKFKNHNILHLATHAEFNTGAPDNSFIIFGNGDKIRLNEITDWQIPNIDLIVLSACQTGVGKLGSGVEILGFGYQVQKAGAKQAIASLWTVDDAGTQALMEAFYGELQKGDIPVAEALRKAQISLIKSAKYNHPNYWSAFFAIGNGL
jgi:CHAT domain-containing protein